MKVVESWRGNLIPGTILWIPELPLLQTIAKQSADKRNVKNLPGEGKYLLFLRQMDYPWRIVEGRRNEWMPTHGESRVLSAHAMPLSMAWILPTGVFSLSEENLGSLRIPIRFFVDLGQAKTHVERVLKLREQFDSALLETDHAKKIQSLKRLSATVIPGPRKTLVADLIFNSMNQMKPYDFKLKQQVFEGLVEDPKEVPLRTSIRGEMESESKRRQQGSKRENQFPLAILHRCSSLWETEAELPPEPYSSKQYAWAIVGRALNNLADSRLAMQELTLTERLEVLSFVRAIVRKLEPDKSSHQLMLHHAKLVIDELKLAVP
ncbi:MAG TPA: hypothetical protein PLN21_17015 [Gemmatales bacterium]|nr:hypothetical protein [Gemmatales bacterium]